jgi:hypothetical protein
VLAQELGSDWTVMEEELPGQTTVLDDPSLQPLNAEKPRRPSPSYHLKLNDLASIFRTSEASRKRRVATESVSNLEVANF